MSKERYSENMNGLAGFGFLINAMGRGGDGDIGASFPRSDAEDMSRGARFIPGEVTVSRRKGEKVQFVNECGPCCWYWLMPNGDKIYHFEPNTFRSIAAANGKELTEESRDAGACPKCGNVHVNGGTVKTETAK